MVVAVDELDLELDSREERRRRPEDERVAARLDAFRERIANTREEELDTACRELVAIARDRWTRT